MPDQTETVLPPPAAPQSSGNTNIYTQAPSGPGSPSDPPQVKIIAAQASAVKLVLDNVIELAIVGCATWLLRDGKISAELWGAAAVYGGAGNLAAKVLGKKVVPTTAALAPIASAIAKGGSAVAAIKHTIMLIPVFLAFAITFACTSTGCLPDSQGGGVDWPKVAKCVPGTEDAIGQVVRILLADGVSDILSQEHADALEQIAVTYGKDAAACLIDLAVKQFESSKATVVINGETRPMPEMGAAARRGQGFLLAHGVQSVTR